MKLLLICPHFRPDLHAATGEVMTQLAEALGERGHEVNVVTSLPWYHGHRVAKGWRGRPWRREKTPWGSIVRVWPFPTDKSNVTARAIGFAAQTAAVSAIALALGRHDVVMGMSPPIMFGDAAWLAARRSRAPFVFNTQDIFPDIAIELGALQGERVIELARRYERSLYRRADAVTVLSADQAQNVQSKLPDDQRDKVNIIHNFVDLERIRPIEGPPSSSPYRQQHGLTNKTVVMYSGNVGLSQSFGLIRAAALAWADEDSVQFVINGEGAARPEVDRWAAALPNVTLVNFGPREEISTILGAADLHLVLLKSGLAASSTPSKIYSILAAGRPVLASVDEGSEVADVVVKAGAGLAVPPDDESAFLYALEHLLSDPDQLRQMGHHARQHAKSWLTPEAQAHAYEQLFQDLTGVTSETGRIPQVEVWSGG